MNISKMADSNYIKRNTYLEKLKLYLDKPMIKVVIGMRRVGKTVILKLLINSLLDQGVNQNNIVYINKESLEFDFIDDYRKLYQYVFEKLKGEKGKKYLIVDEIQLIKDWEKAVISIYSNNLSDIIISGSNSKLLSSELATLLSGRYIEIPVYPLTFKEFLLFRKKKRDLETEFKNYLKYGGLPGIHILPFRDDIIFDYLNSILNTVFFKDIIARYKIRDAALLEMIVKYLFDNIGNITTAKRVSDYFKSQRLKVSVDTALNYINYIESAFLINRLPRYNIKGKKFLEFYDKIYMNDIGIRHGLIGYREKDINGLIENIVYKELQARGYKIYVGTIDNNEIDFIAEKQNEKKYIQVAYMLSGDDVIKREFGNLEKIKDNYEKIVISMDKFFPEERNGIVHRYFIDFLLKEG